MDRDPRENPRGVRAAQSVLLELWTMLGEFRESMTIVGGSAPPLLVGSQQDDPYVGTTDVDVAWSGGCSTRRRRRPRSSAM